MITNIVMITPRSDHLRSSVQIKPCRHPTSPRRLAISPFGLNAGSDLAAQAPATAVRGRQGRGSVSGDVAAPAYVPAHVPVCRLRDDAERLLGFWFVHFF